MTEHEENMKKYEEICGIYEEIPSTIIDSGTYKKNSRVHPFSPLVDDVLFENDKGYLLARSRR